MTINFPLLATALLASSLSAETITNSIGIELVRIEPGSFTMGQDGPPADYKISQHPEKFDDADWDEKPSHRVSITQPFFMGATEVTLAQYRAMDAEFRADDKDGAVAVSGITWEQAAKFCAWLSAKEGKTYRLPTEAEWEYSCRAGTTTLFYTGDTLPEGFQAWTDNVGFRERFFKDKALPKEYHSGTKRDLSVAQSAPNAWGLHDMHGNLSEWCLDWYGPYEAGDQTDPLGREDGDFRVIRGGHHSTFVRLLRSTNRAAWLPQSKSDKVGFRVVLAALPQGRLLPPPAPQLHAQNVRQIPAKIEPPSATPFFAGPKPFVIIPPNSAGPLFSWHNHSPAITECPNGDLLAVWYSCVDEGGTELNNLASRLRPGKSEWEPASVFWDGPDINDHAPKLWWDGDKTILHLARGRDENIVRSSTDNGVTWTRAQTIQPVSEIGNSIIRTRDGTILMTQDTTSTSLTMSRDGGKTWTSAMITDKRNAHRSGSPARHAGIHAPIVELQDGRLMTIGRLNTEAEQSKFGFKTPSSYSSDGGMTWKHEATEFPAISSVERAVLMRLHEGPLLLCSFTDLSINARNPKGMDFPCAGGGTLHGAGLFAALSFDEGKTWSHKRLVTPGGEERTINGIDRGQFKLSDTRAEPQGYLAACQTRDGNVQLISSKNHYAFNLAWLKELPPAPKF